MSRLLKILITSTYAAFCNPGFSQTVDPLIGDVTGLDLPRFVSTKSNNINVRRGPGATYSIDWVYKQAGVPLIITAEYENWRKIADYQGKGGWVHSRLLSGNRSVIFVSETTILKRKPNEKSPAVAIVKEGVIARLLSISGRWCQVSAGGHKGWSHRHKVWGLFDYETKKN